MRRLSLALSAVVVALAGCGAPSMFSIGGADSTPQQLGQVLARQTARPASGAPVVIIAVGGSKPAIVAYELESQRERWRVDSTTQSRFEVSGTTVVHAANGSVVGRSLATGQAQWKVGFAGTLVGFTGDGERVYLVSKQGDTYTLAAIDAASGAAKWDRETTSRLGAPAARGGQVLVPLLDQWLVLIDGATGKRLGRIRGVDSQISFVRATDGEVTFGSSAGVFVLDERAAEAKKGESTFVSATKDPAFANSQYDFDGYDPMQVGFSAYDRNHRLLWRMNGSRFAGEMVVAHAYRFLFGFDQRSGAMSWAYMHPRVDLVASSHTGRVIGLVSSTGQIAAIDPSTGTLRYLHEVAAGGPVVGATFAAEGWQPTEEVTLIKTPNTTAALDSIVRDRDMRFAHIKKLALAELSKRSGDDAVNNLIAVVIDESTGPQVYESAVKALVARQDPASLPAFLAALDRRFDHVQGVEPRAVGVLARAIGHFDATKLSAADRAKATAVLLAHLEDPATTGADLTDIVGALGVVGDGSERPALRQLVLHHRADGRTAGATKALTRALEVLAAGSAVDRAVVEFVAGDPRSVPSVAREARAALAPPAPADASQ